MPSASLLSCCGAGHTGRGTTGRRSESLLAPTLKFQKGVGGEGGEVGGRLGRNGPGREGSFES